MTEEVSEQNSRIPAYEPKITEEPELDMGFEGNGEGETLAEAEEKTEHLTDIQAVLNKLHPHYRDRRINEILQSKMASRVFPENYWDLFYFLVMSLIEEHEGDGDVDILMIISCVQDALSIAFEGRGRVEDLELAGVAHEQEMERLSRELGMGG